MAQEVSGPQGSQAPQVSQEEKEKLRQLVAQLPEESRKKLDQLVSEGESVIDKSMIGITLAELGILEIEMMLMGCLGHPDVLTLDSWHRWANEALDHNDLDKAIQLAERITKLLEDRWELCKEYERKSRKHNKRYSRHSSRH